MVLLNINIVFSFFLKFMSPIPSKQKICHSGLIPNIVDQLSTLMNVEKEQIYRHSRINTKQCYDI